MRDSGAARRMLVTLVGLLAAASRAHAGGAFEFDVDRNTFVLLHIPKTGGTSFGDRLVTLEVEPRASRCEFTDRTTRNKSNGHAWLADHAYTCRRTTALRTPNSYAKPDKQLAAQWLISPLSTGWWGAVHPPFSMLQSAVDAALKKLGKKRNVDSIRRGMIYVTFLRRPFERMVSEFYESVDGWEFGFKTPPHPKVPCSEFLARQNATRTLALPALHAGEAQRARPSNPGRVHPLGAQRRSRGEQRSLGCAQLPPTVRHSR